MPYQKSAADTGPDGRPRRSLIPEVVLVIGLSLLAAWMLRSIAPPSLVRDGVRLPVGLASQHGAAGHHAAAGGLAPSPVSDEPVPHFLGAAFLAAHLLAAALAIGIRLVRRLRVRSRLPRARFAAHVLFAALVATAAGGAVALAARFGYGDRLASGEMVRGALDMARYAFAGALAMVVIFGFRGSTERSGV